MAANQPGILKQVHRLASQPADTVTDQELLTRFISDNDRAALDACYAAFTVLNVRFKRLVRAWQVAAAGGTYDGTTAFAPFR